MEWEPPVSYVSLTRIHTNWRESEICIRPCTDLRNLTLDFTITTRINMRTRLISLLRDASAPNLRTLTLRVSLAMRLLEFPWDALYAVLAQPQFARLDRVVFSASWNKLLLRRCSFEKFEAGMKDLMVGFRQRGILQFQRCAY
jgi:hypothetical protein